MNLKKLVEKMKNPINKMWGDLIKLNHKLTKEQYQNLQVDGKVDIELDRNEINLLKPKYGKFYKFTNKSIESL